MGIALRVNQLNVDPHVVARFLQTSFKNVRNSKLLRDLTEIARFALIKLGGSARNHFQIRDASQTRQNFFLNPICKIGVIWIAAEDFEWKHCGALLRHSRQHLAELAAEEPHCSSSKKETGSGCYQQLWITA